MFDKTPATEKFPNLHPQGALNRANTVLDSMRHLSLYIYVSLGNAHGITPSEKPLHKCSVCLKEQSYHVLAGMCISGQYVNPFMPVVPQTA